MYIFSYKQSIHNYKNILLKEYSCFCCLLCPSLAFCKYSKMYFFVIMIVVMAGFFFCSFASVTVVALLFSVAVLKKWFDVRKWKLQMTKPHMHKPCRDRTMFSNYYNHYAENKIITLTSATMRCYLLLLVLQHKCCFTFFFLVALINFWPILWLASLHRYFSNLFHTVQLYGCFCRTV